MRLPAMIDEHFGCFETQHSYSNCDIWHEESAAECESVSVIIRPKKWNWPESVEMLISTVQRVHLCILTEHDYVTGVLAGT